MALSKDRKSPQYGTPDEIEPKLRSFPAAAVHVYAGGIGAINSSGYGTKASADATLKIMGRIEKQVDNSGGQAGDLDIPMRSGVFHFASGTGVNTIAADDVGKLCYASDDQTVNLTDNAGTWPAAGTIWGPPDPDSGDIPVYLGQPSLYDENEEAQGVGGGSASKLVKGVVYNNQADLTAFVVASDEGITYAAGDVVLLVGQTTAAQNGPYVVGTVATTAPLTRPDWWATGGAVPNGFVFEVAHGGTWYGDSRWKCTCTGAKVIGTDDPLLYPNAWRQVVTLASGTYTIGFGSTATPDEPLYLLSTTRSTVHATRDTAGGTLTTVVQYVAPVASRVAGKNGTAVVIVRSAKADGSIDTADTSTVNVTIINF